jgi:hypothetical protein
MGKMDRSVVKMFHMDDPDFKEKNMCLCEGSPQECWDQFWDFAPTITALSGGKWNFFKPIRRDVVKKTYRTAGVKI